MTYKIYDGAPHHVSRCANFILFYIHSDIINNSYNFYIMLNYNAQSYNDMKLASSKYDYSRLGEPSKSS